MPSLETASISKMERRSDMYISTLSKITVAMGGELQIVANMPNGRGVQIRQFTKIRPGKIQDGSTWRPEESRGLSKWEIMSTGQPSDNCVLRRR